MITICISSLSIFLEILTLEVLFPISKHAFLHELFEQSYFVSKFSEFPYYCHWYLNTRSNLWQNSKKLSLNEKKFKMAFKTFQAFKMQSFIIWKLSELLELFQTLCFFKLFQMIPCSNKPILVCTVLNLNSELKFSSFSESFWTCSKI